MNSQKGPAFSHPVAHAGLARVISIHVSIEEAIYWEAAKVIVIPAAVAVAWALALALRNSHSHAMQVGHALRR